MWKTIIFHCRLYIWRNIEMNECCIYTVDLAVWFTGALIVYFINTVKIRRSHGSHTSCLDMSRSNQDSNHCTKSIKPLINPDSLVQQGNIWTGKWTRGSLLSLKNKCPWARQLTPSCSCGAALWEMEQDWGYIGQRLLHLPLLPQATF